ncbi:efflux RND transporter periplasmic adaptor subunit [Roseicyclus sp. F158]|uniref:Efflux RND transporter periplasmic adaptor subunit n=1 Tax=Tropicimonas omnivorans TaxID=3075590 RepID=A0ABU3DJI7_9RHOB|nr:efflux RND transporter periplasmic adaptor subunit [Roseicyclus sp. F158]MDT0683887.1 efflux RND transporter periplasmic adaptor subunit [Roseicyclus sp. F158]
MSQTDTPPAETSTPRREEMNFDGDRGASRSKWVAGLIVVLLAVWMGSGFMTEEAAEPAASAEAEEGPAPVSVAVRTSEASSVIEEFLAEGQAEPDRQTAVVAQTSGTIDEVAVTKGADVEGGALLGRIALAERRADLENAREARAQAQRTFDNAQTLLDRGVGTQDRLSESRSALAAAEAQVAAAEEAIEDTEIRAPFAGRVEVLDMNVGEVVQAGGEVARIVDNSPLTVGIQVPQQILRGVRPGLPADVTFITGEVREGTVVFVGSSADTQTRTFTAEIEVPNDGGEIPAGISASVRIPTGEAQGHFLSPAILSLGTSGELGIKTVDDDNVVTFHPVTIIRAETEGVWVAGLPDTARIITVGQGFVSDGETVTPRAESETDMDVDAGGETADAVAGETEDASLAGAALAAESANANAETTE